MREGGREREREGERRESACVREIWCLCVCQGLSYIHWFDPTSRCFNGS